jgi:hypothetical protein
MEDFNVQTASFKELAQKAKELGIKSFGVKAEELRAVVAEALSKTDPDPTPTPAPAPTPKATVKQPTRAVQLVYGGVIVTTVTNRILSGRVYKDIHLANGEVHTLTKEEYELNVKEN